jgi:hypothetical protein
LQILDRTAPPGADPPSATQSAADGAAATAAAEWHEDQVPSGHWREDKVGLLLTMHRAVSTTDPCPDIPPSFVDATRIPDLVRELSRSVKPAADVTAPAAAPETEAATPSDDVAYQPPPVEQRKVLASRRRWPLFAPIVAAAAWAWGFQGAARKAFVGDGSANHGHLQRRFFGSFVPILDFIHALSYVYAAATAGQPRATGGACYRQWIAWVWQGQVARVLTVLEERQAELGLPEADEAATSPRRVVDRTVTSLRNQQHKMP